MPPRDVGLKLCDASAPITGTGMPSGIPFVETEGSMRVDIVFQLGVITDADEVFNFDVEVSKDDGANWFPVLRVEPFTNDEESSKITRMAYIPKPTYSTSTYQPSTKYTRVRLNCISVSGTTPSLPLDCWIEPIVSLGIPEFDEVANQGLANLYT